MHGGESEAKYMTSTDSRPRKENIKEPPRIWTDPIVRWLRTNAVLVAIYIWISHRLVPLLFAVFIVAPIGVLILPFFIPKFIRNARRRRKYEVDLSAKSVQRIHGTSSDGPLADRTVPK